MRGLVGREARRVDVLFYVLPEPVWPTVRLAAVITPTNSLVERSTRLESAECGGYPRSRRIVVHDRTELRPWRRDLQARVGPGSTASPRSCAPRIPTMLELADDDLPSGRK